MKRIEKSLVAAAIVALILSASLSGCNKPTAEMKRAEAAIAEARNAGAAEYASSDLTGAEDTFKKGVDQMDALRYKTARSSFEEAYRLALAAKEKALAAKPQKVWPGESAVTYLPYTPPTSHTVYSGECLWRIAEYKDIYNDPFQWPLIYDANRREIDRTANRRGFAENEQDWIFPGQEFAIPRDASTDQIKNARRRAGAPTPYMPPGY